MVLSTDEGALSVIQFTGSGGYSDSAGNVLNLSISSKSFSKVIANHDIPEIFNVTVQATSCGSSGGNYYCASGKSLKITFKFKVGTQNVAIREVKGSTVNVLFDGVKSSNTTNWQLDSTTNSYYGNYNISGSDNGKMTIKYTMEVIASNGVSTLFSDQIVEDCDVYADNKAPTVGGFETYLGSTLVDDSNIYASPNTNLQFKILFNEASSVVFDTTKVLLVNEQGTDLLNNSTISIAKIETNAADKFLLIDVVIMGEIKNSFKIKLDKNVVADYFGNTLATEYLSTAYTVDTNLPEFEVNVKYPQYKGYYDEDKWVLISGDTIDFEIVSDDVDLKDYCIIEDASEVCEQYEDLDLMNVYSYSFGKKESGEYSFYVRVRDVALNVKDVLVNFIFKDMPF